MWQDIFTAIALYLVLEGMIPFISPLAKAEQETSATEPGTVIVEINWPPELDTDVETG